MKKFDLDSVFDKAKELEVYPLFKEIIEFLIEFKPFIYKINKNLNENIKEVPGAKVKLTKVSSATEDATIKIMDIVDGINNKLMEIQTINQSLDDTNSVKNELNSLLDDIASDENTNPELKKRIEAVKERLAKEHFDIIIDINNRLNDIINDTTNIMLSLQVQDITSQQLAAVNHLLTKMQKRFSEILSKFEETDLSQIVTDDNEEDDINVSRLNRDIAFDPEAINSMSNDDETQSGIDSLIDKFMDNSLTEDDLKPDEKKITEEEIVDEEDLTAFNEESSDDEFSQDDIDKLFG